MTAIERVRSLDNGRTPASFFSRTMPSNAACFATRRASAAGMGGSCCGST